MRKKTQSRAKRDGAKRTGRQRTHPAKRKAASSPEPKALKRAMLKPPPKHSPEEEELWATWDMTEIGYLQCERLRRREHLTPEQKKRLTEHDAIEKRIAEDPEGVMREAYEAIDRGTPLLLKLVRSRRMFHELSGISAYHAWDQAFDCFNSRLDGWLRELVRMADKGVPRARQSLFYAAKILAEAFVRLAAAHPADFRDAADSSLTMPSLRARNPAFTADADAIVKAINLGAKHPAADISDNRTRMGALCHYLVANLVDRIERERWQYREEERSLKTLQQYRETAEAYKNVTVTDLLRGGFYPTRFESIMQSHALPELKDGPEEEEWWKHRVLPMVRAEFERIAKKPDRNAALWEELKKGTDNGTPSAMLDLMAKHCRNKLGQIARGRREAPAP